MQLCGETPADPATQRGPIRHVLPKNNLANHRFAPRVKAIVVIVARLTLLGNPAANKKTLDSGGKNLPGKEPPAFDSLFWNADVPNLLAAFHQKFLPLTE